MFEFIWNLFGIESVEKQEKMAIISNHLQTYIVRHRYLRQRDAAIVLQAFFRYCRSKRIIQKRLRSEGNKILEEQFILKKKWLIKLRSDLYKYIHTVDKQLKYDFSSR